jgi:hypothetical protein
MGWEAVRDFQVYVPKYFKVEEFFPQSLEHLLDDDLIWLYIDSRVLVTADRLREKYGTAIMNTWAFSTRMRETYGTHQFRGWRPRNCEVGAELSQHKLGCAADMGFVHVSAEKVRQDLLSNPFHPVFRYITAVEMNTSWFHFSVQPHDKANNGVLQFYP